MASNAGTRRFWKSWPSGRERRGGLEGVDPEETARTAARWDRIAPLYDRRQALLERQFAAWRENLWTRVPNGRVLEVGFGTGKNLAYHGAGMNIVGIDLSDGMLTRARERATELNKTVELYQMDVQRLDLADQSFDAAVATFVFCSVPNAVQGLRELRRVVKPGGVILLLEHVRIDEPKIVGRVMDWLDPVVVRLMGSHINRRTEENARRAGLGVKQVKSLAPMGMVKLIVAVPS